jgi:hypothetical protein
MTARDMLTWAKVMLDEASKKSIAEMEIAVQRVRIRIADWLHDNEEE